MTLCWCAHLPSLLTRTRLVFLQHPRERRMPVGTCRMAHLALPNSELHVGVRFEDNPRVCALAAEPATAVLYPAETPEAASPGFGPHLDRPPSTLVVIDGTWSQARKMLARNTMLVGLPRLALRPTAPGNYRIRKEPFPHALSTVEAVVAALEQLEPPEQPQRFRSILQAFTFMVDRQLEYARARLPSSRRHQKRYDRARSAAAARAVGVTLPNPDPPKL